MSTRPIGAAPSPWRRAALATRGHGHGFVAVAVGCGAGRERGPDFPGTHSHHWRLGPAGVKRVGTHRCVSCKELFLCVSRGFSRRTGKLVTIPPGGVGARRWKPGGAFWEGGDPSWCYRKEVPSRGSCLALEGRDAPGTNGGPRATPKPMSALETTPSLPRGVPGQARAQDSDREGTLSCLLLPSAPAHSLPFQQPGRSLLSPLTFPTPPNFWWLQHPRWLPKQLSVPSIHLEHPTPSFCGLNSI